MGNFFNNGSMTMKFHILNVLYDLESHAKEGRCGLYRNEDIRRYVGKLVEKQTLSICQQSMSHFDNVKYRNHVGSKVRFKNVDKYILPI